MESRRIGRRELLGLLGSGVVGAGLLACGDEPAIVVSTPTPAPVATLSSTPRPATTATVTAALTVTPQGEVPLLRVIDKDRGGLARDYVPSDLVRIEDRWAVPGFAGQTMRAEAAAVLVRLLDAADKSGTELRVRSTFRSYGEQVGTFQFWVDRLGEAQAKRLSAPAGHSEHQLGTTADISSRNINWELLTSFGDLPEGKWVDAHAHEFGFAISYPRNGEAVTGYMYEPWHIRYIGTARAAEWKRSGMILVKFLEQLNVPR